MASGEPYCGIRNHPSKPQTAAATEANWDFWLPAEVAGDTSWRKQKFHFNLFTVKRPKEAPQPAPRSARSVTSCREHDHWNQTLVPVKHLSPYRGYYSEM